MALCGAAFGVLAVASIFAYATGVHAAAAAAPNSRCVNVVNTGGGWCTSVGVKLSPRERAIFAAKQALAAEYARVRAGTLNSAAFRRDLASFVARYSASARGARIVPECIINPNTGQCDYGTNVVNLTQQPQKYTDYCGPATAAEVLGVRQVNETQDFLAGNKYLGTIEYGETPWNPYVMGPTLNLLTGSSWYVAVNGSAVGGGFSTSTWENDLTADIDDGWGIAGNIVEYANTDPHLVGHPRSMTIYHWIGIYGYSSYGGYTDYADSVAGDTKYWSWAANVPAYSSYSSSSMTTLLNQRGFVW